MATVYLSKEMSTSEYTAPSVEMSQVSSTATTVSFEVYFEGEYVDATVVLSLGGSEVLSQKVEGDSAYVEATGLVPSTAYTVEVVDDFAGDVIHTAEADTLSVAAEVTASSCTATTASLTVSVTNYSSDYDFVSVYLYEGTDTSGTPVGTSVQTRASYTHGFSGLTNSTQYTYVVMETRSMTPLTTGTLDTADNGIATYECTVSDTGVLLIIGLEVPDTSATVTMEQSGQTVETWTISTESGEISASKTGLTAGTTYDIVVADGSGGTLMDTSVATLATLVPSVTYSGTDTLTVNATVTNYVGEFLTVTLTETGSTEVISEQTMTSAEQTFEYEGLGSGRYFTLTIYDTITSSTILETSVDTAGT